MGQNFPICEHSFALHAIFDVTAMETTYPAAVTLEGEDVTAFS